jgi:hypothetical protein
MRTHKRQRVLHPVVSRARVDNPTTEDKLVLLRETAWNSATATGGCLYGEMFDDAWDAARPI